MTTKTENYGNYDIYATVLLVASGVYIFYNLWSGSLYPWDEGWYSEIAREIVVEGKGWLTFTYNYRPWMEKPPLFIWMVASAFKVFGVNEFAVRIWSALFSFGSVILLYFFAESLFSSKRLAFFSSLSLIGFHQFVRQGKLGMMDGPMTFFVLLGIYFFWKGRKDAWNPVLVGIVTGIAFMIKSFAAFQIPLIIAVYCLAAGEWKRLIEFRFISGFVIGFLICLPWHMYQYHIYGKQFIDEYFIHQIFTRSLQAIENYKAGIFYYFGILIIKNIPLGAICLFSTAHMLFLLRRGPRKPELVLPTSAVIAIILLFSLVRTKFGWYILPIYPFLSMSTAVSSVEIIDRAKPSNRKRIFVLILTILIATPFFRIAFDRYRNMDYRPEIKTAALAVKANSGKSDKLLIYRIPEEPVILFYSERSVYSIDRNGLLSIASDAVPFICLMEKEDRFFEELKDTKYRLHVVKETENYILYKRDKE